MATIVFHSLIQRDNMADLKMYLTSLEPNMSQSILSQSIGGYISNTLLYPEATVNGTIGLYDTSFNLNIPSSGNWNEWTDTNYISINDELMEVSFMGGGAIGVVQRGVNNEIKVHINNDIARAVSQSELFNDVFNVEYKQYRCIAVKNSSQTHDPSSDVIANNILVYLGDNSRNDDSKIKIAIETPKSQYISGSADRIIYNSSVGTSQLVDSSLEGIYAEDLFKSAYLKILSGSNEGQGRVINSYNSTTGIFNFSSALTEDYNVAYEVLPSPSQRIKNGMVAPNSGGNTGSFMENGPLSPIQVNLVIGENASLEQGSLGINDVFYIWMERTINKASDSFDDNSVLINIKYDSTIG